MRLNPDCIRDVMLYLEDGLSYGGRISSFQISEDLSDRYFPEDILYSVDQLSLRGWISRSGIDGAYAVRDILPEGHDFLESVRDPENYSVAKSRLLKIGAVTLGALKDVAIQVISDKLSGKI